MTDASEKIRILEKMRWQETRVSKAMEPIQRALLERVPGGEARDLLGRVEKWWQDVPDAAQSLAEVPVVREALALSEFPLPDDPVTLQAFTKFVEEVRALTELRNGLK